MLYVFTEGVLLLNKLNQNNFITSCHLCRTTKAKDQKQFKNMKALKVISKVVVEKYI